jgi:hypothetical protein
LKLGGGRWIGQILEAFQRVQHGELE